METLSENTAETQTAPMDITERLSEPPPLPKPVGRVTYAAAYGEFGVECELGGCSRMVSVYRREPNQGFSACNPPLALLEAGFAAWLESFLAECQRRFDARGRNPEDDDCREAQDNTPSKGPF